MPLVYVHMSHGAHSGHSGVCVCVCVCMGDAQHVSTASRSPELEAAEAKLWSSFQQFCLAAQGLYQGCMCSWECYVGEHSDEQCDPDPDLTCDPDVRTSLLRWRPGQRRVADDADGGQTDSDTLEDPRRSENFRCDNFALLLQAALCSSIR